MSLLQLDDLWEKTQTTPQFDDDANSATLIVWRWLCPRLLRLYACLSIFFLFTLRIYGLGIWFGDIAFTTPWCNSGNVHKVVVWMHLMLPENSGNGHVVAWDPLLQACHSDIHVTNIRFFVSWVFSGNEQTVRCRNMVNGLGIGSSHSSDEISSLP